MATPAVTTKEKKVGEPIYFKGDNSDLHQARSFLLQCRNHLFANDTIYPNDLDKIQYVLSYMREGPAGNWAAQRSEQAYQTNPPTFGTWDDFRSAFTKAFISANIKAEARRKVMAIHQLPNETVTSFNARFQTLARQAEITEFSALQQMYLKALNANIAEIVVGRETEPTAMDSTATTTGLYEAALNAEDAHHRIIAYKNQSTPAARIAAFNTNRQWRPPPNQRNQTFNRARSGWSPPQRSNNITIPGGRQPPPTPRRSNQEIARFRAENRCFHCGLQGHRIKDCTRYRNSPPRNLRALNFDNQAPSNYTHDSDYGYSSTPNYYANQETPTPYDYPTTSPQSHLPQRGNRNPFRSAPTNDSNPLESGGVPDIANIRKVITTLPAQQFNELFDALETKDF